MPAWGAAPGNVCRKIQGLKARPILHRINDSPHKCPVPEVHNIIQAVMLSGVWRFLRQTESKDLRFAIPIYAKNFRLTTLVCFRLVGRNDSSAFTNREYLVCFDLCEPFHLLRRRPLHLNPIHDIVLADAEVKP